MCPSGPNGGIIWGGGILCSRFGGGDNGGPGEFILSNLEEFAGTGGRGIRGGGVDSLPPRGGGLCPGSKEGKFPGIGGGGTNRPGNPGP